MAEALISALLEQLASINQQEDEQEERLVVGVEKEVANLTDKLQLILEVLEDAEKRQVKEANVRHWLDKLKEVCYEMDDVLNEWINKIQKQRVEKQEKGDNAFDAKKKVCFSISSHYFSCPIARKIKKLSKKLTMIANESQRYNKQNASSFVAISGVLKQEEVYDILISMLLNESSQEGRDPLVISIVGRGGIEKTILAELVFNDQSVKGQFENRIWIDMLEYSSIEVKIAEGIFEGLNQNDTRKNSDESFTLVNCIRQSIMGKKFLLVLDDVSNLSIFKWVKDALQEGARGSRILVTTRKEEVAITMGSTTDHMIQLDKLSEQICWSLFYQIALVDRERDETLEAFEAIGKNIIKKCNGLPFVANMLGNLMWNKKTIEEWRDVLDGKMWEEDVEQQVFQPLLQSYHHLNVVAIKRYLLCCAICPKGYKFDKDVLIALWMSQHCLNLKENRQIAEKYFKNSILSFFHDFEEDDDGNITGCKMHDIVHDLVQFLTKDECVIMEVEGANNWIELPAGAKVPHLCIRFAPQDRFPFFPISFNWKNLRTLATFDSSITALDSNLILQLKYLRTLNLSHNRMKEVPKEIGELVHLRYIDLSHNPYLKRLPRSLCNLYNLQSLNLVSCTSLKKLPEGMGKLINLKHLHVKDCNQLRYFPKGIGRLTSLRRLDEYSVCGGGGVDDEEAFKLGDLGNFEQLQGSLSIKMLGNVKDAGEAQKAQLGNKKHLLQLELDFENEDDERRETDDEILAALKTHENLKVLRIGGYDGGVTYAPFGMDFVWNTPLHNLRSLILDEWKYCETLPPLGQLLSLERLEISGMHSLKILGKEFLSVRAFPQLKQLSFRMMHDWQEWESRRLRIIHSPMPRLSSLRINSCSLLKTLPNYLPEIPLQDLTIDWCPILAQRCQKGAHLWPLISHVPNITINGVTITKDDI